MTQKDITDQEQTHQFGGDWTTAKLRVVEGYLHAYTTALKNKPNAKNPFWKEYIDAFAGTGYREEWRETAGDSQHLLFPDLADSEPQDLLDGSARIALRTKPRFDKYIFIEKRFKYCKQLEQLGNEFPDLAGDISVRHGDANGEIQDICDRNWQSHRAVLLLDPYGMQVDWKTIEAIARTKAIDLWVLFPLGIGVNRLLKRSGDIPESWRQRLNLLLGTEDWYDEFYRVEKVKNLFGDGQERVIKASMDVIGRYFIERLNTIFEGVVEQPGVLRNSRNSPLYLFCFAAGNKRGATVAKKIASSLLRKIH
jgi:three-Cys-motif partner protein